MGIVYYDIVEVTNPTTVKLGTKVAAGDAHIHDLPVRHHGKPASRVRTDQSHLEINVVSRFHAM